MIENKRDSLKSSAMHGQGQHSPLWEEDISRPETPCEILFEELDVAF